MKKFSISIFLTALIVMQFVMSTAFAKSENFEENFLGALGLIEMDENYNSNAPISRIEFVKAVFKATRTDTEQYSQEDMQPFFDVTENDEFFNIANTAYNMGIIKGGTDGCFRPYATISTNEATTILLRALYGTDLIEKSGGVDALADTLRLYKDLTVSNSGFTYKNAAVLMYNTLSADYIERNFDGSYYFDEDKSLLSELYDIECVEGMVDGNYKQSVYESPTRYNFITIDGELYKLELEKYNNLFFGQNVEAYYIENDDEDLVIVYMEAEKGEVFELDFDELEYLDSEKISYIEPGGKKVKEEKLSKTCITMHNNVRINLTDSFDVSGNGSVICIDRDDDGYIDMLDITTYDIYIVKNVNMVYERLTFENSDTVIALEDYKDVRIVDKNGKSIDLGDILRYNVVEISTSEKYMTMTVISDKASITVSGITKDTEKDSLVISADDGTEYKTVKGFNDDLRVGLTYTFALDSKGNICAKLSDGDSSSYKIGVVMSTNISEDFDEGMVKLMGTDEQIYKIKVPEKVNFLNYNKRVTYSEAIAEIKESLIIRFSEKDGIMKAFEIPSNDEKYPGLQKIGELPNANNAYTRYWKQAEIIGGIIPINSETVIVRQDGEKSPSDESAYGFEKMSDLVNGLYYPATIGYRVGNDDVHADIIVMKIKIGTLRKDSPIMLIQEVYKKYDSKTEEIKTVFKGLVNNAETELTLGEEDLAYYKTAQGDNIELAVGDCIRYAVDKQNRIVNVKLIFDYSNMRMYGNDDGNDISTAYGVENLHRTGVVDYVRENYVKIIADGLAVQEDYLCSLKNTGVYQVSVQNGRIVCEPITAFDIGSLEKNPDLKDKVFVRMHQGVTGVFIVYKQD